MRRRALATRRRLLHALVVATCLPAVAPGALRTQPAEQNARADFAVSYHGQVVPWRRFLLRALPGESVALEIRAPASALGAPATAARAVPAGSYEVGASSGTVRAVGPRSWTWQAPDAPGLGRIVVRRLVDAGEAPVAADSIVLTAAVLVPLSQVRAGRVEGFRVGDHPAEVYRGLTRYRKPRGFIRVSPSSADVPVSPHFRLGQFSVKQPDTWPRYTVLHERLLLKLELLVERAARAGVPAEGWQVLSAYRSPWYNRSIGRPQFSRHIFGDAADLYVDADRDGRMDDLNGDGRSDIRDAALLHDLVERMDADPALAPLLGGLGRYGVTANHGAFIHVDTRGYRARW